jgi:hypothetical protein
MKDIMRESEENEYISESWYIFSITYMDIRISKY